ncbi:hypothetical protein SAMN05421831_10767 [Allopseudospirillum japonicum]|uniref:Permease n=1 Tax=Allopseudospirillum japonicum TaxID=64971 RepID=A0A1H6SIU3_9GAMM|nr:AEC family transporter [Allopseudospirillum japonicum]SEI67761.1 hypothetical protein SAMN05421831_10767 [Allopseudospirillum japonicum]
MQTWLSTFETTLAVTGPVFLLVFLGALLYRAAWINDVFVQTGSQLVFRLTLPLLIFISILKAPLTDLFDIKLLAYVLVASLLSYAFLVWIARHWITQNADKGAFIQGGFRGNLGIVGVALALNQYGATALGQASLLLAWLILVYNFLSVIALNLYSPQQVNRAKGQQYLLMCLDMIKNPLILAVAAGAAVRIFNISVPDTLMKTGQTLGNLTLPMALLCIGASLNLKALREDPRLALMASGIKLILIPVVFTLGAWLLGYQGQTLGILFLFFASPTAAASYVMARAMGANAALAANIIAMTTLGSIVTLTLGVFIGQSLQVF